MTTRRFESTSGDIYLGDVIEQNGFTSDGKSLVHMGFYTVWYYGDEWPVNMWEQDSTATVSFVVEKELPL